MKREFEIPVTWEMYGTVTVEAETVEEAYELAMDDEQPLPDESYYVDGSFEPSYTMEEFKENEGL